MGSNDGDADEKPVHRVTLPGFYLGSDRGHDGAVPNV